MAQSDINFIILGNAVNYRCNGQYDSKAPPSLAEYEEEVQRQYGGRVQVTTTGDVVRLLQSRSKRDEVLNLEEAPKRKKGVWGQIISKVLG